MPITLKETRELTDRFNIETADFPNLTFTPLVDLKVICPETKGCIFTECMHREKHSPVEFEKGTCFTTATMCLDHTLKCVPIK